MGFFKYICVSVLITSVFGQVYDNRRCRCVCPSLTAVLNSSVISRKVFKSNVPPDKCNCDGVILPLVSDALKARKQDFCPRCECKYETRNTTIIMVVVMMLIWVILLLSVYMGFLICLDPLINRRRVKLYQERDTEEAEELLLLGLNED